jgi:hypothetical protein
MAKKLCEWWSISSIDEHILNGGRYFKYEEKPCNIPMLGDYLVWLFKS